MTTKQDTPLTKAERLAIGGAVAPIVRRQADAPRKVTLVGKDGQPVGVTTSVEVAKSLLARSEIEFSVQPGKRPEFVKCKTCSRPIRVRSKKGKLPVKCPGGTYRCPCGRIIPTAGACARGGLCKRCTSINMLKVVRPATPSNRRHSDEEIRDALSRAHTIQQAASLLGLAESTLCARAKRLGLGAAPTVCPCGAAFTRVASAVGGRPPRWCYDCQKNHKKRRRIIRETLAHPEAA